VRSSEPESTHHNLIRPRHTAQRALEVWLLSLRRDNGDGERFTHFLFVIADVPGSPGPPPGPVFPPVFGRTKAVHRPPDQSSLKAGGKSAEIHTWAWAAVLGVMTKLPPVGRQTRYSVWPFCSFPLQIRPLSSPLDQALLERPRSQHRSGGGMYSRPRHELSCNKAHDEIPFSLPLAGLLLLLCAASTPPGAKPDGSPPTTW